MVTKKTQKKKTRKLLIPKYLVCGLIDSVVWFTITFTVQFNSSNVFFLSAAFRTLVVAGITGVFPFPSRCTPPSFSRIGLLQHSHCSSIGIEFTCTALVPCFPAQEFTASTQAFLTGVDDVGLGAEVTFTAEGVGSMRSNLVRGMAYVTATYEGHTTPVLSSTHAFLKVNGNVRNRVLLLVPPLYALCPREGADGCHVR